MEELIAAIVVALIASSPGIIALFKQKRKDDADAEAQEANAAEKIQEAAIKMMDTYKKEFEALKEKITNLETRVRELECILKNELDEKKKIIVGAWQLHDQVKELQGTPKYVPPKHEE